MARSTIQEKLSGKSSAKLHQILSLVEAIAEYGRTNGAPLSQQEVDENSWRAKFIASNGKHVEASTRESASGQQEIDAPSKWNSEPLLRADMTDLVDLIAQSEGAPPHTWLPHVASEMRQAQMSCDSLMKWAAQGNPRNIVQCVSALDEIFPLPGPQTSSNPWEVTAADPWGTWSPGNAETVGALLRYAARSHGTSATPVIVVGLRRAKVGEYVQRFLTTIACWHLAPGIQEAVDNLKAAELTTDAMSILKYVGSNRQDTRVMEVVRHFDTGGQARERDAILGGMASDPKRFMIGIRGTLHEDMQEALISAVPLSKHSEYAEKLNAAGFEDLSLRFKGGYTDEPPF
ncbi:hypothetical protein [Streptomyces sp. NPDC002685]|uniref:hypothetical protein n=1 Tax=Streptomyces sp. NPDC002685 TaxID=3154540 RepID=UPI003320F8A3